MGRTDEFVSSYHKTEFFVCRDELHLISFLLIHFWPLLFLCLGGRHVCSPLPVCVLCFARKLFQRLPTVSHLIWLPISKAFATPHNLV